MIYDFIVNNFLIWSHLAPKYMFYILRFCNLKLEISNNVEG